MCVSLLNLQLDSFFRFKDIHSILFCLNVCLISSIFPSFYTNLHSPISLVLLNKVSLAFNPLKFTIQAYLLVKVRNF